jgi:hypothetical protein
VLRGVGGRTIAELRANMTRSEFLSWVEFYKLFPFDDLHRYHRPAALIAASMGGKYEDRIEFLSPEPNQSRFSRADLNTMKALGIKPKRKED